MAYSKYMRFDRLQKFANILYYKYKRNIYSDFKTFGSCNKIPYANAIDFIRNFYMGWDGKSEYNIYELGVGNGLFALNFLEGLSSILGNDNPFLKSINYFLCDISFNNICKNTRKALSRFNVDFIYADVSRKTSFIKKPIYIRSNEMYDDIPTRIFVNTCNGVMEVEYKEDLSFSYFKANVSEQVIDHVSKMPLGYHIPINQECINSLLKISHKLVPNGYFDIYDYGFLTRSEIKQFSPDVWNTNIVREYGTQLTVDVNFDFLHESLARNKVKHTITPQKAYAENVLGEKLFYLELDNLYYLTRKEILRNQQYIRKYGYSYKDLFSGIEEHDDYKHLRIKNQLTQ